MGNNANNVEIFFSLAHHKIIEILFGKLIALKEKILHDFKPPQKNLFCIIIGLFNSVLGLKRVDKLLRNTKGFETISQMHFWEPLYFSPKWDDYQGKMNTLWFSLRISRRKLFTKAFVTKYVVLARDHIVNEFNMFKNEENPNPMRRINPQMVQTVSQIILESEQGEFLLELVSNIPEKSLIIQEEYQAEQMRSHWLFGKKRALMRCANCKISEKTEKEFQKCSRCETVYYCGKACQRSHWKYHKSKCKNKKNKNKINNLCKA